MNCKKLIQSLLVGAYCTVLSVAGAQQRPVFIPAEYEAQEVQADFRASGPTLLFSDSPETVYHNGILYRDTVEGDVRLFLHHVNGVDRTKKLAVLLRNKEHLRPVSYAIMRQGGWGLSNNYLNDGKLAEKQYFSKQEPQPPQKLGFGSSRELLSGCGLLLPPDKLYTATIDLHLDKPLELSVLLCEQQSDLELFNENAVVQPMDEHPLRGTFASADWEYTLKEPVNAPKRPLKLKLASNEGDGFIKGVDATTGLPAENYGNYGVVYKVHFEVTGSRPVSFIFSPIGGAFAGYGVLEEHTKGSSTLLALPQFCTELGSSFEEAVELAKLKAGRYTFIWSPPGASNLPIELYWE